MNDSWIALVDQHGLNSLVLETSHAVRFMLRRAERLNAECFWVVLTPQHAIQIEQLRRLGNTAAALSLLERLAINMGRITPPAPTLRVWIPDCVTVPDDRDMEWNN